MAPTPQWPDETRVAIEAEDKALKKWLKEFYGEEAMEIDHLKKFRDGCSEE